MDEKIKVIYCERRRRQALTELANKGEFGADEVPRVEIVNSLVTGIRAQYVEATVNDASSSS